MKRKRSISELSIDTDSVQTFGEKGWRKEKKQKSHVGSGRMSNSNRTATNPDLKLKKKRNRKKKNLKGDKNENLQNEKSSNTKTVRLGLSGEVSPKVQAKKGKETMKIEKTSGEKSDRPQSVNTSAKGTKNSLSQSKVKTGKDKLPPGEGTLDGTDGIRKSDTPTIVKTAGKASPNMRSNKKKRKVVTEKPLEESSTNSESPNQRNGKQGNKLKKKNAKPLPEKGNVNESDVTLKSDAATDVKTATGSLPGNTSSIVESNKNEKPSRGKKTAADGDEKELVQLPKRPDEVSANWKQFQLLQGKTKKNERGKHKKTHSESETNGAKSTVSSPDIWFDDVDEIFLETNKTAALNSSTSEHQAGSKKSEDRKEKDNPLVKQNLNQRVTKIVAMDCEMVGVGDGRESILARVSIVNHDGYVLYDSFVRPREKVVDYRTAVSGVRPEDLKNAEHFEDVQKKVAGLIEGKILVGHALHHDLKVLYLSHPRRNIRDTSRFKPFRQMNKGRTPGLKTLSEKLLGVRVQSGEHSSVEDAQATMRLYTMHRKQWEKMLQTSSRRTTKTKLKTKSRQPPVQDTV